MTPHDEVVKRELGPRQIDRGLRRPIVVALALALVLLPAALLAANLLCADGRCGGAAQPTPDIASPVDGVIVSVDAGGLDDVRGFTLRPAGSPFAFELRLGDLENPTEFPPAHLAEHQATSSPVRAYFRLEGGARVVYRLEDAPPG